AGEQQQRIKLEGEIPSAASPPDGCVFHTRCPRKIGAIRETTEPPLIEAEAGHFMRCHIPIEELRVLQTSAPVRLSPAIVSAPAAAADVPGDEPPAQPE